MVGGSNSGGVQDVKILRLIALILLVTMCVFKLFLTFRGLDQPAAMEQAQIARSVAQGHGFDTKSLRPVEVVTASDRATRDKPVDFTSFRDSTYAPLNVTAMAVALKVTGMDTFENCRMVDGAGYLYAPDRVIAAVSTLFFMLAMLLSYTLAARLFDEVVACVTVSFLVLSDLLLKYSVSGLPQPLMLCGLLGALHCMLSAVRAYEQGLSLTTLLYVGLAFVCCGLMCLSGWMGLWPTMGLLLFCCLYFRSSGYLLLTGALVTLGLLATSAVLNYLDSGSVLGNAMMGLYNSFGGGEEMALRSAFLSSTPLDSSNFVLRFLGYSFSQLRWMYENMGSIIVVPFFLLALLNRYRREDVQGVKWAGFCMWAISCVGMALYGVESPLHVSQLAVLFAPLFTAYGISLVFNFLARHSYEGVTFNQLRGLAMFIMVLVSAGPFLATVPKDMYMGIWLGDKGRPHYPPYYPPALNIKLADITNERDVIVTDQPWAVAWYANRTALWIPSRVEDLVSYVEPALQKGGVELQGFLITPSSHSAITTELTGAPGGMAGIVDKMGDFAPLAMEGKILQLVPRHNLALADMFTEPTGNSRIMPLGQLVSSRGRFSERVPLLGAELLYYGKPSS